MNVFDPVLFLLFKMYIIKNAIAIVYNYPNQLCCYDHFGNPTVYSQQCCHPHNRLPFPWFVAGHKTRHHHFSLPHFAKCSCCNTYPVCQPLSDLYSICMDHCVKISHIFQNEQNRQCGEDKEKFTTEILSTKTDTTTITTTLNLPTTDSGTNTPVSEEILSTGTETTTTTTLNLPTTYSGTNTLVSEENDIEHVTLTAFKQI